MRNLRPLIAALFVVFFTGYACTQQEPQFSVRDDLNVSLVSAVFEISPQGFANWGDLGFIRPEADAAVDYFGSHRGHDAVVLMGDLTMRGFFVDRLMRFALEAPAFDGPLAATHWSPDLAAAAGGGDVADGAARLDALYAALRAFYHETEAASWWEDRADARACALDEISRNLPPPGFITAIEDWYGDERAAYELIIAPTIYATMGFGVQYGPVTSPRIANVAAPFIQTSENGEYGCGYDDPDAVTELTRHEFGHSFVDVREALAPYSASATAALHAPIADAMQQQAYGSWPVIVEEHIVRLGEIRVAERMGEPERAERLRRDYIDNRRFIYLPLLEEAVLDYESARGQWPQLSDYIPILIQRLYQSDAAAAVSPE